MLSIFGFGLIMAQRISKTPPRVYRDAAITQSIIMVLIGYSRWSAEAFGQPSCGTAVIAERNAVPAWIPKATNPMYNFRQKMG